MTQEELKAIGCTSLEELIAEDFGEVGTPERAEFELGCDAFIIGERLKAERLSQGMTQQQLADKIGTKKSFISRIENGRVDIQLSTLSRIFNGLGRRVAVTLM
ncbi:MAG: helix-turn-helix transcriptional regulator [Prevotellaceae bacterium]|nr:helix-turn-helix transcriptional regulator [Candidatus Minthosoma caballi]